MQRLTQLCLLGAVLFVGTILGAIGATTLGGSNSETVGKRDDGTYEAIARAWGDDLFVRSYPSRAGYFEGVRRYGEEMFVVCAVEGEQITWNSLSSNVWYQLRDGTFTTSVYVELIGTGEPPACSDDALGEPPSGSARPTAYAELRVAVDNHPLRNEPISNSEEARLLPNRSALTLTCYEIGDEEEGLQISNDVWYLVEEGGWINDAHLITGNQGQPPVEACG